VAEESVQKNEDRHSQQVGRNFAEVGVLCSQNLEKCKVTQNIMINLLTNNKPINDHNLLILDCRQGVYVFW